MKFSNINFPSPVSLSRLVGQAPRPQEQDTPPTRSTDNSASGQPWAPEGAGKRLNIGEGGTRKRVQKLFAKFPAKNPFRGERTLKKSTPPSRAGSTSPASVSVSVSVGSADERHTRAPAGASLGDGRLAPSNVSADRRGGDATEDVLFQAGSQQPPADGHHPAHVGYVVAKGKGRVVSIEPNPRPVEAGPSNVPAPQTLDMSGPSAPSPSSANASGSGVSQLAKVPDKPRPANYVDNAFQTDPSPHVSLKTLSRAMRSLGPTNNRDAISSKQDVELFELFAEATRIPLPKGVKASDFVYNPYDCPIVEVYPGGPRELGAFEFNDTGYAGIECAPEKLQRIWMRHWRDVGTEMLREYKASLKPGEEKPLLVLVGSSEGEVKKEEKKATTGEAKPVEKKPEAGEAKPIDKPNNKTFIEKLWIGETVAEAMGGETIDQKSAADRFASGKYWPPEKPLVVVGYSNALNDAVVEKDGRAYLYGVEVKRVLNGRTAANMQKSHRGLASPLFPRTNLTNEVGTDKGSFMRLMHEFNTSREGQLHGYAYGLQEPRPFGRVEHGDRTDAEAMDALCNEIMKKLEEEKAAGRGDVVVKPSGTGHGSGITCIEKDSTLEVVRNRMNEAAALVRREYGTGAGFPWAIQTRLYPVIVDGYDQEVRMVSYVHEGHMHCVPVIVKKNLKEGDGFVVANSTTADTKLTAEEKRDPDYITRLSDAALNEKTLKTYKLDRSKLISAAKYLSSLSVYALKQAIAEREQASQSRA